MEAQNLASHESVSSEPCMDFQLNFNNIQNNHETTSANSSNSVEDGAVHLQQHIYHHQIHQNTHPINSPIPNFSPLEHLSLSLKMRSADPHPINIINDPSLFPHHNLAAATSTLNTRRQHPRSHNPMPFRLQFPPTNLPYHDDQAAGPKFNRKRARDGAPMHCIVREYSSSQPSKPSIHIKGGIGNYGRIKNQSTHVSPLIAQKKKNPLDGRLRNSVYDITFEEVGLPIDPHLRLFFPL